MANCGKNILLAREGTEQQERFLESLKPESLHLNDFGLEQWMEFAYNFASHVNYFDTQDAATPKGNWQDFFKTKPEIEDFISELEKDGAVTPHLALFVTFLKLLEHSKQRFNKLTKRHLDFYFGQILQIEKQKPTADKVHVVFELAKNAVAEKIEKETLLDGGKDANSKKLLYEVTDELIANKTKVASLKSVYNDHDNSKLKAAAVADSFDGKGEDFPDKEVSWWPFGYYEQKNNPDTREYPELADAKVGFAVAGEILELQEGKRTVQLRLSFAKALAQNISAKDLQDNLSIFCTGEKDWLGPFEIINTTEFVSGSESNRKDLNIAFQIPNEEKMVMGYSAKTHGESFKTSQAVCRILIKTGNKRGHQLYRNFVAQSLTKVNLKVTVCGIKNPALQNDVGALNPEKPFYPFGNQPVEKSKFHITYPELFKKNWDNLKVNVEWKNAPDSLKDWYEAYQHSFLNGLSHQKMAKYYLSKKKSNLIVKSDSYFTAEVEINDANDWKPLDEPQNIQLFHRNGDSSYTEFSVPNADRKTTSKSIRLSLNQSFLHDMFPRLYALSITDENASIPNEPYTPFIEQISLDYSALATFKPGDKKFTNEFQLFHEHPFGQSEVVPSNAEDADIFVVPEYCKGGELYIGLENAAPQQIVSLLIQVLEGSENPEVKSFVGKQHVEWDVLCSDNWQSLDSSAIISNNTGNLLKSGILKFNLPKEANTDNALLPAGLIWLRARIHKNYNAVSKVIGIHAQAVLAKFNNNDNDLKHLSNSLPAETISKMVNRIPKVKGLTQPYNSFGGKPQESDEDYYRRISERLRHKNRAVSIWDYEHLVLQNFPEIHKAKCLSHTCTKVVGNKRQTKYLAPGSVVVVVIPDIVNKNVFDIYQPRVSKATLSKIQQFLKRHNSKLVQTLVINPEYEEVRIDLKVKFHKGYDSVYYKSVLNDDLTRFLSPWAFDRTAPIRFGQTLHKSVIINYTEQLDYVDFITDVRLFQKTAASGAVSEVKIATPSSPEAILVSSKQHSVKDAVKNCLATTIEPAETCQK